MSFTNTTLEYNMSLDNGTPLTMSKLDMDNDFTAYDSSGPRALVGYSSMRMDESGFAHASHGFPNLTYGETMSMLSDPEITVYHDMVTEAYRPASEYLWVVIPVAGAAAVAVIVAALMVIRKRRAG